jgi:hypothetical protein
MDKKTFVNQIKSGCKLGVKGKEQKECQRTMMCNWDKCQKEQQELEASILSDDDRKSCENKDWQKQNDCLLSITRKRGMLDKLANAAHCEANKCPGIRKLNEKRIKNFMASSKSKKSKKSKKSNQSDQSDQSEWADLEACRVQHCSKEKDEKVKTSEEQDEARFICYKKFNTSKAQTKCFAPSEKKYENAIKRVHKCSDKHCQAQMDAWRYKNTKKS